MTRISKILKSMGFKKMDGPISGPVEVRLPKNANVKFKFQGVGKPLIAEITINKGEPCSPGCSSHHTHPCEKCGQQW